MSTRPVMEQLLWACSGDLGRCIHELLVKESSTWICSDGYRLEHPGRNISIWIANKAYGLRVAIGGQPHQIEIRPTWAERQLVFRAVRNLNPPTPEAVARSRALEMIAASGGRRS